MIHVGPIATFSRPPDSAAESLLRKLVALVYAFDPDDADPPILMVGVPELHEIPVTAAELAVVRRIEAAERAAHEAEVA